MTYQSIYIDRVIATTDVQKDRFTRTNHQNAKKNFSETLKKAVIMNSSKNDTVEISESHEKTAETDFLDIEFLKSRML